MVDAQQPEPGISQITTSNTKQEMLAACKEVVKRLKEKRETELKPQQRTEEKQKEEAVKMADSLSTEGIAREVGNLRSEIGKVLIELSDRMEEEMGKYLRLKRAVEAREKELKELLDIEKEALSRFSVFYELDRNDSRCSAQINFARLVRSHGKLPHDESYI